MRHDVTIAQVRALVGEGHSRKAIARMLKAAPATVRGRLAGIGPDAAPGTRSRGCIPVEPFRRAAAGKSLAEVAARLDWYDRGSPDSLRVRRALGLRSYVVGGGAPDPRQRRIRTHIQVATAERLCDALNLDPHEMGL